MNSTNEGQPDFSEKVIKVFTGIAVFIIGLTGFLLMMSALPLMWHVIFSFINGKIQDGFLMLLALFFFPLLGIGFIQSKEK